MRSRGSLEGTKRENGKGKMMKINVVGRVTDGFFRYQAWPTVTKDGNGVLYAASSGHRLGHVCPFGKNYLYISRDEGECWTGPIVINDTYMDDRDAGLCAWGDGNVLLNWFSREKEFYDQRAERTPLLSTPLAKAARELWQSLPEGQHDPGAFVRVTHDGGKTWGEKVRVPVTSPHGPIRKADGKLLFFGKVYMAEDENTYPDGQICAIESDDDGKTWYRLGLVENPEGFSNDQLHEPYAIELSDGTILGGIRVHGEGGHKGLTVYTTVSRDGGRTWMMPEPTGICGTPPHFLLHSSGAVVMTYGCRVKPFGERARISWDSGITWGEELFISEEAPDWDLGYPSSVELSDGSILTVYYQKYSGDSYNSILSTRWELPR